MVKKGFIFSLIAVLIVLAFSFIISNLVVLNTSTSTPSYVTRATAIDTYYGLLSDYYLPSVLEESSYAALQTMINYTVQEKKFYPAGDFEKAYRGLLENETFTISLGSFNDSYIQNKSVTKWTSQFENLTKDFLLVQQGDTVTIKLDYSSLNFTQTSPWEVTVVANFNITFQSKDFTIGDQRKKVTSKISLIGLFDPYYIVHSNGTLLVPFRNETEVVNVWSIDRLADKIPEHRYYISSRGPSFIQRFQNVTVPSAAGVESFIDPAWVYPINAPLKQFNTTSAFPKRSYMDFLFFNDTYKNCQSAGVADQYLYLYNLSGVSNETGFENFRLDINDTVRYAGPNYAAYIETVCGGGTLSYE